MPGVNATQGLVRGTGFHFRMAPLLAAIIILVTSVFQWLAAAAISDQTAGIVAIACLFVLLLYVVLGSAGQRCASSAEAVARMAFFIWWFLLISEAVFDHMGDTLRSLEARFSPQAYGEGAIWALALLAVLILSIVRPAYIGQLFRASNKWISLFALLCVASAFYSPSQLYALAWSFKLVLVVLLLQLCGSVLRSLDDVVVFLRTTLWAFVVLTVGPVLVALASSEGAFEEGGRLNASPTGLSPIAACLLLLALILNSLERRKSYVVAGGLGAIIMFLAFGKTGIIAGILSALLFYCLQKKFSLALVLLAGSIALGAAVVSLTPLANYLESYSRTGQANTFTGRTDVWAAALPAVRQKIFLGHGYLASYFTWVYDNGPLGKAGHLHNGFLEVAYNNGIVGLFLIVMIHYVIAKNILISLRMVRAFCEQRIGDPRGKSAYVLSIGCLVLYLNLLTDGMFEASFGARAMSPFMLLLAIFVISDFLQRSVRNLRRQPVPAARIQAAQLIST